MHMFSAILRLTSDTVKQQLPQLLDKLILI
jgi:hypothetical protein